MKITQFKRQNGVRTPKDPTPRNPLRKAMRSLTSPRKIRALMILCTARSFKNMRSSAPREEFRQGPAPVTKAAWRYRLTNFFNP